MQFIRVPRDSGKTGEIGFRSCKGNNDLVLEFQGLLNLSYFRHTSPSFVMKWVHLFCANELNGYPQKPGHTRSDSAGSLHLSSHFSDLLQLEQACKQVTSLCHLPWPRQSIKANSILNIILASRSCAIHWNHHSGVKGLVKFEWSDAPN